MFARRLSVSLTALLAALSLATAGIATAQTPAPDAAVQRPHRTMPTPVNLQVLPKDMSGEQVIQIMHHFTGDLGVECSYCHAKSAETGRLDFASDANPMKTTARVMMRMTHTIDSTYLSQLTIPKPVEPVTCGTCHRGMAQPPIFIPQPRQHGAPPPAAAPSPN